MDGFGSFERVFDDPHVFNNFNAAAGLAATIMTPAQQDDDDNSRISRGLSASTQRGENQPLVRLRLDRSPFEKRCGLSRPLRDLRR
jgi:hypothetical protein